MPAPGDGRATDVAFARHMPEIGADAARDAHAQQDRHHGGRGGDQDPRQVPARARERGVGPAARAHLRQDVPAHLRGLPRARLAAAGRGVQAALRAPGDAWSSRRSRRAAGGRAASARRRRAVLGPGVVVVVVRRGCCSARSTRSGTLGRRRRRTPARTPPRRPTPTATPDAGGKKKQQEAGGAARVSPLQIVPTGTVNVCLVDARRARADRQADPAGGRAHARRYRGKRFRVSFGNGEARHARRRASAIDVPDAPTPVGYDLRPGQAPARAVRGAAADLHMSARAGIVVTGTEVLSGIISDRNGPWLSERLRERGVELAHIDRSSATAASDLRAALDFLAGQGVDLIVTSGGLGPDRRRPDRRGGRRLRRAPAGARRGARGAHLGDPRAPARPLAQPRRGRDPRGQPQAGARARRRDGARAGRHGARARRAARGRAPTVLVLPGPPRELQPMWETALETEALRDAARRARAPTSSGSCACSGSRSRRSRARCARSRPTACRSSSSRSRPACGAARSRSRPCSSRTPAAVYDALRGGDPRAPRATRCSPTTARRSTTRSSRCCRPADRTVAVAESCTGGLMAARLTDRGGSSAYVLGGVVAYSNEAKIALAGVPADADRGATARCRPRSRRRWPTARATRFGARRRHRHHRHRRARAAGRRRSRSARCA